MTVSYRGYKVHKCGPWTQGPYLCQTLSLLEGYDLKAMGHFSADYLHTVVEALKLSMADRDEFYGDPKFVKVPAGKQAALARLRQDASPADRSEARRLFGTATGRPRWPVSALQGTAGRL